MIDIHSHIIPNIDDGAKSWEETLEMCEMAWKDGTKTLVATPHAYNGMYGSDGQHIAEEITILRSKLKERGIELEVLPGAEVHCRPDLADILAKKPHLTLNSNGRYFLLEFPHTNIPPNVSQMIFELGVRGFIPIIAHPERNLKVQKDISLIKKFVEQGAMCQVTAMSLTGRFGDEARKCSHDLLEMDCVHVVASDTHSAKSRPPMLSEACGVVEALAGKERARELFVINPRKILKGEI